MRKAILLGFLVLLGAQTASALYLDRDGQFDGANGPTDHYRDVSSGGAYHYDSTTRVLRPAPTFSTADPLYLQGVKVSFYENGSRMDNVTLDDVTCGRTFCLAFQMRLTSDWDGAWQYRFRGTDEGTGLQTDWSRWFVGVTSNGMGRPVVSGSDTYVVQQTRVQDCEVQAILTASSSLGLGTRSTAVQRFTCST